MGRSLGARRGASHRDGRGLSTVAAAPGAGAPAGAGGDAPAVGTKGAAAGAGAAPASDSDDKPMGWGKFLLFGGSVVGGIFFSYYFYKADYRFDVVEVLLLERWRTLPFYPRPELRAGVRNGLLDGHGLTPELINAFAEWFVATDLQSPQGVLREDVLELLAELGLGSEEQKAVKAFVSTGDGRFEEQLRQQEVGLQESVSLLATLAFHGADGSPTACRVGPEGLETLRAKSQRGPSIMAGARALGGGALGGFGTPRQGSPATASVGGRAAATAAPPRVLQDVEESGVDEAEMHRLEDARLARLEDVLLQRLNRQGSLSAAEESRLQDLRLQRSKL